MATEAEKKLREKQMNLLLSILSFETYWAYFSMSSGNVHITDTKAAAKQLLDSLEALRMLDENILDPRKVIRGVDMQVIDEIFDKLKKWVGGKMDLYKPLIQDKVMFFVLFAGQKSYLIKQLGLAWSPPISFSTGELEYTQRNLRWYPHLPRRSMWEYDKTLDISRLSTSQTVVVYGDIKRSQDLMTYTIGPKRFQEMMIRFLESVRNLFDDNLGIFDKFTGDGFLGYFNEYLCSEQRENFLECFVRFSRQCIETSYLIFNDWKKWVRKLPEEDIMLSIGADAGEIYFGDEKGHLICIGDSIVWAQRMCAAAPAGKIYVNNILASLLKDREGVQLLPVGGKTKTGESFLASEMHFA
jgi:class 3 adenylate cyclase